LFVEDPLVLEVTTPFATPNGRELARWRLVAAPLVEQPMPAAKSSMVVLSPVDWPLPVVPLLRVATIPGVSSFVAGFPGRLSQGGLLWAFLLTAWVTSAVV